MNLRRLMVLSLIWIGTTGSALGFQTAAEFPVSWVEQVDVRNHLLTFKTEDGQVRMFRVAESVAMRREWLRKGDLVSIEVDLDDQIVNIVKADRRSESNRRMSPHR